MYDGEQGGDQDFYDFGRVATWHEQVVASCGVNSIFDLKMLFIPVHKNGNHWNFIKVDMASKQIGIWEPYGCRAVNQRYLESIRRYLYDVHVKVKGQEVTGTYDDWVEHWSIYDHDK